MSTREWPNVNFELIFPCYYLESFVSIFVPSKANTQDT